MAIRFYQLTKYIIYKIVANVRFETELNKDLNTEKGSSGPMMAYSRIDPDSTLEIIAYFRRSYSKNETIDSRYYAKRCNSAYSLK